MEKYKYSVLFNARDNPQLEKIFNIGIYLLLVEHEDTKAVTDAIEDTDPVICYDAENLTIWIEKESIKLFKRAYLYHRAPSHQGGDPFKELKNH